MSLVFRHRGQSGLHVFQHLDKDTSQPAKYHVTELIISFSTDKHLRSAQLLSQHDRVRILDLHHPLELTTNSLLVAHVQHDSTNIRFVDRSNNFHHQREPDLFCHLNNLLLVIRNSLFSSRYPGSIQQSMNLVRRQITVLRVIHHLTDLLHVHIGHFKMFWLRGWSLVNLTQGISKQHLIREINTTFRHELRDLVLHDLGRREYRENRFLARLHLLVKYPVHVEHGEQTGATENNRHPVNIVKILITSIQNIS